LLTFHGVSFWRVGPLLWIGICIGAVVCTAALFFVSNGWAALVLYSMWYITQVKAIRRATWPIRQTFEST